MKASFPIDAILILILLQSGINNADAQPEALLELPAFTDVSDVPWRDSIYRFPSFQKGKITYTKGFELDYEFDLNYNLYYEKMNFVSSEGDTLEITNTREIKAIQVGEKTFYHDYKTGYYELVLKLPVALAKKDLFYLIHQGLIDIGYTKVAGATPIQDVRGAASNFHRYYDIQTVYFFIDPDNHVHAASRASIVRLFPEYRKEILAYLIEHRVNFDSGGDMHNLVTFCNKLKSRE